jgi:heme-degrading monooxygenase HmoA
VVLEVAILDVKTGMEPDFEIAFGCVQRIIASMPGYISHELQHCLEKANRYILLVNWETLESHTVGFRGSPQYQEWRALLHHFYDPFPVVEHYVPVFNQELASAPK